MDERAIDQRRAVYRFFAEHARAPRPAEIGATRDDFERLEREHAVVLDADGGIAFSNPFADGPTAFSVNSGATRYWAICAWDAFGILAATGRDGSVETACPDCDEPLRFEVPGGDLRATDAVAHFLLPASRWYEDLRFT